MASIPSSSSRFQTEQLLTIAILLLVGALIPTIAFCALWTLDADGVSMLSGSAPEWDFSNIWTGGHLAAQGRALDVFDTEAFRAWFRTHTNPNSAYHEWSYPPHMLLIARPLAQLPLFGSYLLWTFGSIGALWLVLWRCRLPLAVCAMACVSPGVLVSVVFGQTGIASAALFLGGLLLLESSPLTAGILIGCLTMKPQLGLLIPVCLIAAGRWRPLIIAALTAVALLFATILLFGLETLPLFVQKTTPLMRAYLERPPSEELQMNQISVFHVLRGMGASLDLSYAVQIGAALAAATAAWRLWRRPIPSADDQALRVGLTGCLGILATPYVHNYDSAVYSFTVALLIARGGWKLDPLLVLCWLWPALANMVNVGAFPVTPFVILIVIWLGYRQLSRQQGLSAKTRRTLKPADGP